MYDFLEGEVAERTPARIVLLVGGVGYDLAVPVGTSDALRRGARARLHVHLHVTDGEPRLFGFGSRDEREVFRLLLAVNGVGPATALSILSSLPPPELGRAVEAADAASLRRVKGVGEKTSQRLILELKGKLAAPPAAAGFGADAVAALVSLGYARREAEEAVERASRAGKPKDLESLVRAALSGKSVRRGG